MVFSILFLYKTKNIKYMATERKLEQEMKYSCLCKAVEAMVHNNTNDTQNMVEYHGNIMQLAERMYKFVMEEDT